MVILVFGAAVEQAALNLMDFGRIDWRHLLFLGSLSRPLQVGQAYHFFNIPNMVCYPRFHRRSYA